VIIVSEDCIKKKMEKETLPKSYEPHEVENRWYRFWLDNGYFKPDMNLTTEPYCIVIPPPNVTGSLHMGHALNNTLQDILVRFKRMQGFKTLWQCGTDHAGIATQNVVERGLAEENMSRFDLGREEFVRRVWKWREQYGGIIIKQLMRLGASCDWSRERFTMDEGLSRAVREVFVSLYREGLIYRGKKLINWCPRCHTALSDLEVEHDEIDGNLYYIKYPSPDGNRFLTVATTRPETMLGDTAIAVNPKDKRYKDWIGTDVLLPLMNRPIPVIGDAYVDLEFGTGALKITPAHDPNDFEIGQKHSLDLVKVIGEDGTMTEEAGQYQGLDRFEARKKVLDDLKEQGLLLKIEPYRHFVGHCYRCKKIVEPNLSMQWFVNVKPLAERAIEAVEKGETRIIPQAWEKTYFEWMNNIRDWCISRQIWWGHRIPAWYCGDCGEITVERQDPSACGSCGSKNIEQESDVLDTWFSSALWPFSTLGWPEKTPELATFYPTSCLVTGFDILFFWVARMMMMGLKFMGQVPFRDVYIHALVRDVEGQKMSKSKGNVIDPLEVIDKFGTDSFRFTLAAMAAQGRDIRLAEDRIEGYRHFVNKLWNAARFVLMNLDDYQPEGQKVPATGLRERWIISRMNHLIQNVVTALDEYKFNEAAHHLYQFIWHEFCDWYLEMIKPSLYQKENAAERRAVQSSMVRVLKTSLELLHPIMPFVTEEIWQQLPGCSGSISVALFPKASAEEIDAAVETEMEIIIQAVTALRNLRSEMNISPAGRPHTDVLCHRDAVLNILQGHASMVCTLAGLKSIAVHRQFQKPESAVAAVIDGAELFLSLEGLVDFSEEKKRLEKEMKKVLDDLAFINKKLANRDFIDRAPKDVIEKEKGRAQTLKEREARLQENIDRISRLCT
jgi:valyl-tRNA synthetase